MILDKILPSRHIYVFLQHISGNDNVSQELVIPNNVSPGNFSKTHLLRYNGAPAVRLLLVRHLFRPVMLGCVGSAQRYSGTAMKCSEFLLGRPPAGARWRILSYSANDIDSSPSFQKSSMVLMEAIEGRPTLAVDGLSYLILGSVNMAVGTIFPTTKPRVTDPGECKVEEVFEDNESPVQIESEGTKAVIVL